MNEDSSRKALKMEGMRSDEEVELERVLTRLASISSDEARLEQVLKNLLPKLLDRLQTLGGIEIPADRGPKKLLIEIFSHVTRWVKAPSTIKLPIQAIGELISIKCERNSQALRVSMVFLDMGFDRSPDEEKLECLKSLLVAQPKLGDTEKSLVRILFPLVLNLDRSIVRQHAEYLADLCLDCCYPLNFFSVNTPKGSRIALANKPGRSAGEEHATRMRFSMSLMSRLVDWEPKCTPVALSASILSASIGPRDDVKNLGEELLRRLRDASSDMDRDEKIGALFNLFLGSKERLMVPSPARIKTLEAISRLGVGENMIDRLFQVIIKGYFGSDQAVQVKMQTLRLMGELSTVFAKESSSEQFLSKNLKMLVSQPVDHLTSDHRAALFGAYARWTASRNKTRTEMCTVDIANRIINTLAREHDPEAIDAEYQCLCVVGDELNSDISLLLDSEVLLHAAEATSNSTVASQKLKLFGLSTARRSVLGAMDRGEEGTVAISALWFLCLSSRFTENRQVRDASRRDMERLVVRSETLPDMLPSLDTILDFVSSREGEWATTQTRDAPKDYFSPVLRVLRCKSLLLRASSSALEKFWNDRLLEGMIAPDDETRYLSVCCLVTMLDGGKLEWALVDSTMKIRLNNASLDTWISKNLASDHEQLRRTCAKMCGLASSPSKDIPTTVEAVLKRLSSFSGLYFPDIHGALSASSFLGVKEEAVASALMKWMLDPLNKSNNENRDLRDEAFLSVTAVLQSPRGSHLPIDELIAKAKEATRNKTPEDSMEGIIAFLGVFASQNSDEAFVILLSLTSDARFGLASQQAIGKSLAKIDPAKLAQVTREVLTKSVFEEASQKSRTSAAVLLEQIIRLGGSAVIRNDDEGSNLCSDLVDALVDLLSEVEEMARMCACRALFELYSHVQTDPELKEKMVREVHRRLTMGESNAFNPAQQQPGPPETTTNDSLRGDATNRNVAGRRPRLGRRGAEERVWGFQDLCIACQQSGVSSMVLPLFGIVGCASKENEEERSTIGRARALLKREVEIPSAIRLAVQFMRRRHYAMEDVATKAGEEVFEARLRRERIFESPIVSAAVWTECARLLRDSFLARDRRSACLTMSEIASKLPDEMVFPCSMEEAWRSVFRALDDLDETIASGPATALGRGIKRRTLITLRGEIASENSPADVEALFSYLLDKGLSHPAKPARDLTRAFFVDAIAQDKLPLVFLCPVIEALLRTIGESEMVMLQYAQFHARGGAGTGELAVEAKQLEEFRARIALESPEYRAALRLASRMNSLPPSTLNYQKIARDIVMTVSRAVRTGIGLVALVAAVQMAGFVASEEWTPGSAVLVTEVGPNLLGALSLKFATDPSQELKRRICSSAAMVARGIEKSEEGRVAVEAYGRVIADEYEGDPEAGGDKRRLAATACFELVKRQVIHLDRRLLGACFLGRFDEDLEVAQEWKNAFENGIQPLVTPTDALDFCAKGIASNAYRARRQAARCLKGGAVFSAKDLEHAAETQLGMDLVKMSCTSANWDGKDELIKATGTVFFHCKESDIAQYALFQMLDAVLGDDSNQTPKPKWLLEALFEAMNMILGGSGHTTETKERFLLRVVKGFLLLPEEPLVLASALKCAAKSIPIDASLSTLDEVLTLVVSLLGKSPTWNVRVGAFELLTKMFAAKTSIALGSNKKLEEVVKYLQTTLAEEKKPSVLLSALGCGIQLKSSNLGEAGLWTGIKADLQRLEKNADVGVGKLAHDLLMALDK